MAGERALQREVRAPWPGAGSTGAHPLEPPTTDGGGLGVASLGLGDARGDAVEVPRADRTTDPLDGDPQRRQLLGGGRELPALDQRVDPPQLAPHRGAGAVRALREREHLGREPQPLGPTGRSRARLLPGVQRLDERAVVARPAGQVERRRAQRLDAVLLAVVERQVAALGEQPGAQRLACRCRRDRRGPPRTAAWRRR